MRRAKPHPSSDRLWRLASLGGYASKTRTGGHHAVGEGTYY